MSIKIVFGDLSLGVKAGDRDYIFAYSLGLESLRKEGREYLRRSPSPAFWRATTCNDRGNGFSRKSSVWMGADYFTTCSLKGIAIDGKALSPAEVKPPLNSALLGSAMERAGEVKVTFTHLTPTSPQAEVEVAYTVTDEGLRVDFHYFGTEGLPELPVCGLRFVFPFVAEGYTWEGLSGETYPDRMTGAVRGTWSEKGLPMAQYVVPQECGMRMKTEKLLISFPGMEDLTVSGVDGGTFNFSLLAYTPHEIEAAGHHIELPAPRKSVLTIAAGVRGVGGIDSWGSDARPDARLSSASDWKTSFSIS